MMNNRVLLRYLKIWGSVASIIGLVITIIVISVPDSSSSTSKRLLIQKGSIPLGVQEYEVFYPEPFDTPPEISWRWPPGRFMFVEQRADGFKIKIELPRHFNDRGDWIARGLPRGSRNPSQ